MKQERPPTESASVLILRRVTTWEEWERGRAARRAMAMQISGGETLRPSAGNPRQDRLLRHLYKGGRGLPFQPI
jgi:hypothetical protein